MAKRTEKKTVQNVQVKNMNEVAVALQRFLTYNLHGRYTFRLSKNTQQKIVAYAPWLAVALVVFVLPQLFVFAKTGSLMSITGFFDAILFNRESWVILLVLLVNILLLVDGMSELFEKKKKGWQRIYLAVLLAAIYLMWQLFASFSQPAAPLLSLVGITIILFTLLDIEAYYQ